MVPTAAAADENYHQQQQQQQQQQQPVSQSPPLDYYSDWTGNQIATSDDGEHTADNLISGQSMIDDLNSIDRQVTHKTSHVARRRVLRHRVAPRNNSVRYAPDFIKSSALYVHKIAV